MTNTTSGTRRPGLVLTRRVGERVRIGEHIEIGVLATSTGCAVLAVNAPENVLFYSEEKHGQPHYHRLAKRARNGSPPTAPLGPPGQSAEPSGAPLRRANGKSIIIAPDIRVTVRDARARTVSLRIHAPRRVPIYRSELYGSPVHQHMLRRAKRSERQAA